MSKRLITVAALMGLTLAGSLARADSQDQRAQRQLRESFGLVVELSSGGGQEGVAISEVLPGSAAELAGLRQGDVIVGVGRRFIEDFADLANAILRTRRGERVSIQVERNGRDRTMRVAPRMPGAEEDNQYGDFRSGRNNGEAGGDTEMRRLQQRVRRLELQMDRQNQYGQVRGAAADRERTLQRLEQYLNDLEERVQQMERSGRYGRNTSGAMLGVQVHEWRRQANSPLGGSADEGVEVMAVDPDSPADEAGLRRGDIIIRVNDRDVVTQEEMRQAWQRIRVGQEATMQVLRGRRQIEINVHRVSSSLYDGRDRRSERLQERIERLESRLREMEQNR